MFSTEVSDFFFGGNKLLTSRAYSSVYFFLSALGPSFTSCLVSFLRSIEATLRPSAKGTFETEEERVDKICNKEVCLYPEPDIIRLIRSRKDASDVHVVRMWEIIKAYKI